MSLHLRVGLAKAYANRKCYDLSPRPAQSLAAEAGPRGPRPRPVAGQTGNIFKFRELLPQKTPPPPKKEK